MPDLIRWQDISPAAAADINLARRPDITAPLNENGERCSWPWEPQQLAGAPLGQYHCRYCGAMVVAGIEHLDYSPTAHPLIGKRVHVTTARKGDPLYNHTPAPTQEADVVHTGILREASYDGGVAIDTSESGDRKYWIYLWPALDITETPPATPTGRTAACADPWADNPGAAQ